MLESGVCEIATILSRPQCVNLRQRAHIPIMFYNHNNPVRIPCSLWGNPTNRWIRCTQYRPCRTLVINVSVCNDQRTDNLFVCLSTCLLLSVCLSLYIYVFIYSASDFDEMDNKCALKEANAWCPGSPNDESINLMVGVRHFLSHKFRLFLKIIHSSVESERC